MRKDKIIKEVEKLIDDSTKNNLAIYFIASIYILSSFWLYHTFTYDCTVKNYSEWPKEGAYKIQIINSSDPFLRGAVLHTQVSYCEDLTVGDGIKLFAESPFRMFVKFSGWMGNSLVNSLNTKIISSTSTNIDVLGFHPNNSQLNNISLTIVNPGNATSFDLNLTSNDSSNVSINSLFYPIEDISYNQVINQTIDSSNFIWPTSIRIPRNSVCFPIWIKQDVDDLAFRNRYKNASFPAFYIENGLYAGHIKNVNGNEIKYCEDLNISKR